MTFESDEARRAYFLEKLREKLKDPFRQIEEFPIGEDEDILALSDPPYYTGCPNPFIEGFVKYWNQLKESDRGLLKEFEEYLQSKQKKLNVLVVQRQFLILVIESKTTQFDVMTALPQALAYMLDDPKRDRPTFGLLVNGREFVFVKLTKQGTPQYSLSRAFSILKPEHDLYDVLHILKHIGGLIS